jgi:hypothetical protein
MFNKGLKGDSIIIVFSILGILVLSFLLYDDSVFFNDGARGKAKILGKINTSSPDVRRKYMDNFAWLPIQDLADVFLGDSIFTGNKSTALIKLNSGANISIEPQSLIVLTMYEDNLTLDLQFGSMDAELLSEKSNLKLKMGTEELTLKGDANPSTLTFQKKKNEVMPELKVKKGKFKIQQGKNKESVEVGESFKVVMEPGVSKFKVKSIIGFKEISALQYKVFVQLNEPLNLGWQHDGVAVAYEVEAAEDMGFKKILMRKTTEKEMLQWTPDPNLTKFYWRIKAFNPKDKQISVSEIREVFITRLQAPKVLMPVPEQVITVFRDKDDKLLPPPPVHISLEDVLLSKKYKVEIALTENFENVQRGVESTTKSFEIKDIPIGSYYLRVKSQGEGRIDSPWSVPIRFSVDEQESQRIRAPILVKKEIEIALRQENGRFVWPVVEWKTVEKAEKYVVEASVDSSFKTNVFLETIDKTKVEISNLKEGKYYFRVRGVKATTFGTWSEYGSISVTQPPPGIYPVDNIIITIKSWSDPVPPQVLRLRWDPIAGASFYFLEVSNREDFKTLFMSKITDKTNFVLSLTKDMTYYARVTALNSKSKQLTAVSAPINFEFIIRRPLKPPVPKQPKNKMSYILYKMDVPHIWIEWETDEKATLHIIEFSKDAEFTNIKKTMELKKNNMVLDKNLLKGKIFWRVRSVNEKSGVKSEWSPPQIFFVVGLENEED